ncbi:MAG: glycosyltransferase family 4 protein [Conexivisphaerales archaeon]
MSHDTRFNKLGSEIFFENLARQLSLIDGCEVHIFRGFSECNSTETDGSLIFHNFKMINIPFIRTYYFLIKAIKRIKKLELQGTFEWKILIGGGVGFVARKIKRGNIAFYPSDFARVEYIYTKGSRHSFMKYFFFKMVELGEKVAINRSNLVILTTSHQLSEFSRIWPTKSKLGILLPLGITSEWFNTNLNRVDCEGNSSFIFVGAGERRLLPLFINSLQELRKKGYHVTGIIVREPEDKVMQLVGTNQANIKVYNNVSTETMMELYRQSIALVVPSMREGFCLPIVEAGSQWVPTIASDLPQFHDIIENNKSGILIQGYQLEQWTASMEKLIVDKKLLQDLRQGARKKAEAFNLYNISERLYEELRK